MTARGTALVTGASAGIGEQLARRLDARGYDVVLVARDAARLQALATQLGPATEVLPADLTDTAALARVEERARSVDVLVNNAGSGQVRPFAQVPTDATAHQVQLNVLALVRLTSAALPPMLARGHGRVLNVASVAAFVPGAGTATYNATKAFILSLSEALHVETRGTGVTVTCLAPGFTRTEFMQRADWQPRIPAPLWQTAGEVARLGLDGLDAGRAVVVPGLHNRVVLAATRLLPRALARRVSGLLSS